MDYVTRQFINLTKKFRKDLHRAVSDLNGALHKQTEAIREANQRRSDERRPSPEIITTVNFPKSVEVHQKAEDARDERNYKRATFFVTSLTFGAIAVYAVLVYWQYREMIAASQAANRTAKAAEDTFKLTQKIFSATQAARFVCKSDSEFFHQNVDHWVVISCSNQGEMSATKVIGRYTLTRTEGKHIVQRDSKPINNPLVVKGGYVGGDPIFMKAPSDLPELLRERVTISISITYDNGIDHEVNQSVCQELTLYKDFKGATWGDCESTDHMKAHTH